MSYSTTSSHVYYYPHSSFLAASGSILQHSSHSYHSLHTLTTAAIFVFDTTHHKCNSTKLECSDPFHSWCWNCGFPHQLFCAVGCLLLCWREACSGWCFAVVGICWSDLVFMGMLWLKVFFTPGNGRVTFHFPLNCSGGWAMSTCALSWLLLRGVCH